MDEKQLDPSILCDDDLYAASLIEAERQRAVDSIVLAERPVTSLDMRGAARAVRNWPDGFALAAVTGE